MENILSGVELDELGERIVRDYLNGREVKSVDIEDFVSSYLGLTIRYETIAETDEGKIGFISDGRTPLWINRPEGAVQEIFDENTIVIDQYLLNDYEKASVVLCKTDVPKGTKITKENVMEILEKEVGIVFTHVLEDAGVFKCTEEGRAAFERFIATL